MTAGRPLVVILCAPWPRSGSAGLFRQQTLAYRAMGCAVAVIAVPHQPAGGRGARGFWQVLAADYRFADGQMLFVGRAPGAPRRWLSRAFWDWRAAGRDSALAVAARIAAAARLDPGAAALLRRQPPALIHVNHCMNMGLARRLAGGRAVPILLDTHDVQAERYRQCAIANPFTGRLDEPAALAHDEARLSAGATALLHLSEADRGHFRRLLPGGPHLLLRPTSPVEPAAEMRWPATAPIDFLFVGNGHRANLLGVAWLLREVLPLLPPGGPTLRIAGGIVDRLRQDEPALHAAHRALMVPERPSVDGLYAASRFVLVPAVAATGASIKLVEALALGKFVVATPLAAAAFRDLPGIEEAVVLAPTAAAFAAAMLRLAARPDTVNAAGQAFYARHLSNARYRAALAAIVARFAPAAVTGSPGSHGNR